MLKTFSLGKVLSVVTKAQTTAVVLFEFFKYNYIFKIALKDSVWVPGLWVLINSKNCTSIIKKFGENNC